MDIKTFIATTGTEPVRATRGEQDEWTVDFPLQGKGICCLASDPDNREVVYGGSKRDGIWRSDDCGTSWKHCGLNGQRVKALAVSPLDSDVIYAGTKPARMFISRDGGGNWSELEGFRRIPNRWWWFSPAEPPDFRAYVIAIAPSPSHIGVLLAGVEFGAVVRSEDNGETWSRHRPGALRDCHSLKFHAVDGNRIYQAGGTGGGASFSRDGGITFHKSGRRLPKHYGIVCAADPVDPDIWYVCVGSGPQNAFGKKPKVYLYRFRGEDCQSVGWVHQPLPMTPTTLVTLPGMSGHLYAGLKNGDVWYSTDNGDSWEQMPFNLKSIWHSLLVL